MSIEVWKFSDNKEESNHLFSLVKEGKKTATSSLYKQGSTIPKSGEISVISNFDASKFILIEITEVYIKKFNEVTLEFSEKEGEGNLSLNYWRETHKEFFSRFLEIQKSEFNLNNLILCEEFKVLDKNFTYKK